MKFYLLILFCLVSISVLSQNEKRADSVLIQAADSGKVQTLFADSLKNQRSLILKPPPVVNTKKHIPQKATVLSLIFPGLGQIYNKEPWWRIGLVYAAVGIPAYFFIDNNIWYNKTKKAYEIRMANDSARFGEIDDILKPLDTRSLQYYRNEFRKNRDYSALFFILAWGLNVVDATVYAHLREFDVSNDLSLKIKPDIDPYTGGMGASLTITLKPPARKLKNFDFLNN